MVRLPRFSLGEPVLQHYNAGRRNCNMNLMMFSKHLQSLPLARTAQVVRELGFDGLDLTVRSGGYIEPAAVRREMPEAIKILADAGLELPLLTTAITNATDAGARQTF